MLSQERLRILDVAHSLLGIPSNKYRGPDVGNNREWLDCSGLVQLCILEAEIGLPQRLGSDRPLRHANEFFEFYGKPLHEGYFQEGDIVFFSRKFTKVTHLGIVTSSDTMIHAPGIDGGVVETASIEELSQRYSTNLPEENFQRHFSKNPVGYRGLIKYVSQQRWQKII